MNAIAIPRHSRSAQQLQNDIFRRMTPQQRLECAFRWTNLTLELCRSGVRTQHPDWSPARVEREVFRRAMGIDLDQLSDSGAFCWGGGDTAVNPPIEQPAKLGEIIGKLERLGLPYALSGSLASTAWGRPRATYDADIVIDLKAADVRGFVAAFPLPDWYVEPIAVQEAVANCGEFNVIHATSGTKVDFWIKAHRAADAARLQRRRRQPVAGVECWVLSPEDTILAKLEWLSEAPSDRQRDDIAGILDVQGNYLDQDYLNDWAGRLGVREMLDDIRAMPR